VGTGDRQKKAWVTQIYWIISDRLLTVRVGKFVVMAADDKSGIMTRDAEQERLAGCGEEMQVSAEKEESQHIMTPETETNATTDDVVNNYADADRDSESPRSRDLIDPAVADVDSEEPADIQHLTATQESTLVRSALRMNSLDGEDAALLSEFLSRAQAKRAANAATIPKDADKVMGEELVPNSPSVRSRRALEELDKNSPSPQKPQLSCPTKTEKTSDSPTSPMKDETDEEAGNQASPAATRRSNRTRFPRPPTRAPRPAVPNQIPVRRANGTEFVFLQRTEAQELSLTTRRNTRRNKGDAQLPKYALQAMAKRQQEEPDNSDSSTAPVRRSPRKRAGTKQVSWKEEQLVEYAVEKNKDSGSGDDVVSGGADKKKTASLRRNGSTSKSTTREREKEKEEAVAASPATPRRVRRLALPTTTNITTTSTSAGADTTSASTTSSAKPIAVSTPISKRKKLTPKSPGGGLLGLPAKAAISKTANSSSKAGIKTAKTSSAATSKKTSNIPTSTNGGKTQSSLLKVGSSSAGATPLPKRVRAKKAG
jgi:hypothetical protein